MCSPVSAVVANPVMEILEQRALSTALVQSQFWKRHVDDVCDVVTHLERLSEQRRAIDQIHGWKGNKPWDSPGIAFLDVTVASKVYRKPTHTERYLSFESHYPITHKKTVVRSLNNRANNIPTTSGFRSKEIKQVTFALLTNGYPKRFIIRLFTASLFTHAKEKGSEVRHEVRLQTSLEKIGLIRLLLLLSPCY